ncbi:MAG: hypothetical protein RBU37_15845 [Myxococcota bacterium]|jgi:hypothetical protein|nr:hypothetical protein [Myxococcota bacterium]
MPKSIWISLLLLLMVLAGGCNTFEDLSTYQYDVSVSPDQDQQDLVEADAELDTEPELPEVPELQRGQGGNFPVQCGGIERSSSISVYETVDTEGLDLRLMAVHTLESTTLMAVMLPTGEHSFQVALYRIRPDQGEPIMVQSEEFTHECKNSLNADVVDLELAVFEDDAQNLRIWALVGQCNPARPCYGNEQCPNSRCENYYCADSFNSATIRVIDFGTLDGLNNNAPLGDLHVNGFEWRDFDPSAMALRQRPEGVDLVALGFMQSDPQYRINAVLYGKLMVENNALSWAPLRYDDPSINPEMVKSSVSIEPYLDFTSVPGAFNPTRMIAVGGQLWSNYSAFCDPTNSQCPNGFQCIEVEDGIHACLHPCSENKDCHELECMAASETFSLCAGSSSLRPVFRLFEMGSTFKLRANDVDLRDAEELRNLALEIMENGTYPHGISLMNISGAGRGNAAVSIGFPMTDSCRRNNGEFCECGTAQCPDNRSHYPVFEGSVVARWKVPFSGAVSLDWAKADTNRLIGSVKAVQPEHVVSDCVSGTEIYFAGLVGDKGDAQASLELLEISDKEGGVRPLFKMPLEESLLEDSLPLLAVSDGLVFVPGPGGVTIYKLAPRPMDE